MSDAQRKAQKFAPDIGPLEYRLVQVTAGLQSGQRYNFGLARYLEHLVQTSDANAIDTRWECRWRFSLSLLADLVAMGVSLRTSDSQLYLTWPNWNTPNAHQALRYALERLQLEQTPRGIDPSVESIMPHSMTRSELSALVDKGQFTLRAGQDQHPTGISYAAIFQAAVSTWTMPYRDREGRRARFVLTVTSDNNATPIPAGIVEAGDSAPHDTTRDYYLGFTQTAFRQWIDSCQDPRSKLLTLERRLKNIHAALWPCNHIPSQDYEYIYSRRRELESVAAGRSKAGPDITAKKQIIYAVRLARAIVAVRALKERRNPDEGDLYCILRTLRDLTLPRLAIELTICGALPPFSDALVGKLAAGYAADPRIRAIGQRPVGEILRKIFDPARLAPELPDCGALLITTKGLYPGHAAQYNKAECVGIADNFPVRLRKIGDTAGVSTSLISRTTHHYAQQVLAAEYVNTSVSGEYGSGGGKRQRRLEQAVQIVGLPKATVHPQVQRPIYGAILARNLPDVALLNADPKWSTDPFITTEEYTNSLIEKWRRRWRKQLNQRLHSDPDATIPGMEKRLARDAAKSNS